MNANHKSVCIVGAGVSGLSTGITLLRRGHRVQVLTREEGLDTTSSVAAAFWYPFWTGKEPDHTWYDPSWARVTYSALTALVGEEAGVMEAQLLEYFDNEMSDEALELVLTRMWWKEGLPGINFIPLDRQQVSSITVADRIFRSGAMMNTYVVNMAKYLPYLRKTFVDLGGQIEIANLTFDDLVDVAESYDAVVDCAGLGAHDLFHDNDIFPVEGVVITVAPTEGVRNVILMHTGDKFDAYPLYIVPRGDSDIILGGTIHEGKGGKPRHFSWSDLDLQDDEVQDDVHRIWSWCVELCPQLQEAVVRDIGVGYRPKRSPRVRLEKGDELDGVRLFHNYGHGGGGVTLSWGCAEIVANWVDRLDEQSSWS